MNGVRVIDVNVGINEYNDSIADEVRKVNKKNGSYLINIMSSPGSGKTTTLLRTISMLRNKYSIGVMEADIDASVDAEKMHDAGVRSIQIHTSGECCMDATMTRDALNEFDTEDLDLIFLENVGNLVCTAEQDTGANINIEILSVPEGDDKPLKYPLMFTVCQAVLVNKIDTLSYFGFDTEEFEKRVHNLNPDAKVFFVSAKTGEGFAEWISWLDDVISCYRTSLDN